MHAYAAEEASAQANTGRKNAAVEDGAMGRVFAATTRSSKATESPVLRTARRAVRTEECVMELGRSTLIGCLFGTILSGRGFGIAADLY
jgi:hypothetical protein